MKQGEDYRDFIQTYLDAISAGATGDRLAGFFHPQVMQDEFPNLLTPQGAKRDLAAILVGARKEQALLRNQRFELHGVISETDAASAEATWTGVLGVPFGKLAPGDVIRARVAMFFAFREGLIYRQRSYDCFYAF